MGYAECQGRDQKYIYSHSMVAISLQYWPLLMSANVLLGVLSTSIMEAIFRAQGSGITFNQASKPWRSKAMSRELLFFEQKALQLFLLNQCTYASKSNGQQPSQMRLSS